MRDLLIVLGFLAFAALSALIFMPFRSVEPKVAQVVVSEVIETQVDVVVDQVEETINVAEEIVNQAEETIEDVIDDIAEIPGDIISINTFETLPAVAMGVAIDPDKGYYVEEIGDGLYWLTEGTYTTMFMTTGEGVIVIDAPPSIGDRYLAAVAEVTDEPITHVIYSHSHADHIAGASMFPEDATYIAHAVTYQQLREGMGEHNRFPWGVFVGGGPIPLPTETFRRHYTLEVGHQILELTYRGPAHQAGNLYIYAPRQKTLLLIDVIFPGWSPFKDLAIAEQVPVFINAHDQILGYDFNHLVSGHLNRLATRADVYTQREYILDVEANAAQALQTIDFMAIAAEVGFLNPWRLFDRYLDEVAQMCNDLTVHTWQDRLAGVDVFTFDHCMVMAESLRID